MNDLCHPCCRCGTTEAPLNVKGYCPACEEVYATVADGLLVDLGVPIVPTLKIAVTPE